MTRHRLALCALVLAVACLTGSATAWAARPSGGPPASLPGPPPGADSGFPAAPAAGSVPGPQALGPSATIPTHVSGPGLLSGTARVHGRNYSVAIACQKSGYVSLTAAALAGGIVSRGGYLCVNRRAVANLSLSQASARALSRLGSTLADLSLVQGGTTEHLSVTLETHATGSSYWSDGGMECGLLGPYEPYVVSPNFRASPGVVVDVRPWIAWYTAADGWRWLGTAGVNASLWYQWTATPSGIQEWATPAGAINPWTWAPVYAHPGQHTYAISVFELVYLYKTPTYVWKYGPSVNAANRVETYCAYA